MVQAPDEVPSALDRKEIQTLATAQANLEDVMLHERSQAQKTSTALQEDPESAIPQGQAVQW